MLEEVVNSTISRAAVVRVRTVLNTFLWGFVWTLIFAVLTWMLRDDAVIKYMSFVLAALPEVIAMMIGVYFAIWSPDRLQSEEFVIRQKEPTMIEKKGGMFRRQTKSSWSLTHHRFPTKPDGSSDARSYLLVFNENQTSRKSVIARLDSIWEISNWMAFFNNALCLVSDVDAKQSSETIRGALPAIQFLITELEPGKKKGWLPKSVWTFMNEPISAKSEAAQ